MPRKATTGTKKKNPKTRGAGSRQKPVDGKGKKPPRRRANGPEPSRADDAERVTKMIGVLTGEFPDAHCMLDHSSPFELLVATILAAQCTDAMVNEVTKTLFNKYKTPADYVEAPSEELEQDIYRTGFFRNKTKSLKRCCSSLIEKHGSKVPSTMDELTALDGVGRKTANCVLGVSFGIPGIVVDTHVRRLSRRMGFTDETNPDKIERDLMAIAPEHEWTHLSHLFADLGRSYCDARRPRCDQCPVEHLCPKILEG
jgi:endonuclease-3